MLNGIPDIVKVRLQTTSQYTNALDGARQIFKNEGPTAFYKVRQSIQALRYGLLWKLLTGPFVSSIGHIDSTYRHWRMCKPEFSVLCLYPSFISTNQASMVFVILVT